MILILSLALTISADAGLIFNRKEAKPKAPVQGEYLIVSGGPALRTWEKLREDPHDLWWGNFIRSARIRMTELIIANPEIEITWLVYRPAYVTRGAADGESRIGNILSVPKMFARDYDHPIRLVWFDETHQLIDHINRRDRRNKIVGFEFFGHSNSHAFMFDYSNQVLGASCAWLHVDELRRLRRRSFDRDAYCKSWGCFSGRQFCHSFRRASGARMWGATGKTDYAVLKDDRLPVISDGSWVLP